MPDPATSATAWERDSISNTLLVAIAVSVVCSLLVTASVLLLKPIQLQNEYEFRHRVTVLDVAGLYGPGADIDGLFQNIEVRLVELDSGDFSDAYDPQGFDPVVAAADTDTSVAIAQSEDVAGIGRRSPFAPVFLVQENGRLDQVVMPVYGAGMWSTIYGYLAVDADGQTIRGLRFYEHGETPGLGDQIENPEWLAQWPGKRIYDEDGEVKIEVARRKARGRDAALYKIDGLSGASRTGTAVSSIIRYWTGPNGFGPFLGRLQREHDETL